jgi:hypothetical protein
LLFKQTHLSRVGTAHGFLPCLRGHAGRTDDRHYARFEPSISGFWPHSRDVHGIPGLRTGAPESAVWRVRSAVWAVKSAVWRDGSAGWALGSAVWMLGSGRGNPGSGAWSPGSGSWQPGSAGWLGGSAGWTAGSADGAPGGFQAAVRCLEWRRRRVPRDATGAGQKIHRAAWREGVLRPFRHFFVLLLIFVLAFHVPFLRLSRVRSVIHFPLQP